MNRKIGKIEKRIRKLNANEVRQIDRIINEIYITAIRKKLVRIRKEGETNNERTV